MRRALHQQLPALTWFYGLKPWEVERLTFGEIATYSTWMDEFLSQQAERSKQSRQ